MCCKSDVAGVVRLGAGNHYAQCQYNGARQSNAITRPIAKLTFTVNVLVASGKITRVHCLALSVGHSISGNGKLVAAVSSFWPEAPLDWLRWKFFSR